MKVIEFTKLRSVMLIVSVVLIIAGLTVTFVVQGGLKFGIDFVGGMKARVEIASDSIVDMNDVRGALTGELEKAQIQRIDELEKNQFVVRIEAPEEDDQFQTRISALIIEQLSAKFGVSNITLVGSDFIGSKLSGDLAGNSIVLILIALAVILTYIWIRFRLAYAVSAITALVHDALIMIGFVGVFQIEMSTATIAAILTIIGYSLNDTIVIFDRVRENRGILKDMSRVDVVNTSITQSLSRTIMTSVTTMIAVIPIFIFTSGSIKDFALTFIFGILIGTYSSIFVASPMYLALNTAADKKKKLQDAQKYGSSAQAVDADVEGEESLDPSKPVRHNPRKKKGRVG